MHRLFPEKLVTVITTDVLEDHLVASVRNRGASGYTIVRARGAGSSGEQSGMLDIDTNIKLHVILPVERTPPLLDDLERLIGKGYHLTVYISDVSVLGPEKFESAMI
ncbi:MAG: transcriptional regulator [Gammaproteobacteria bacterium]